MKMTRMMVHRMKMMKKCKKVNDSLVVGAVEEEGSARIVPLVQATMLSMVGILTFYVLFVRQDSLLY